MIAIKQWCRLFNTVTCSITPDYRQTKVANALDSLEKMFAIEPRVPLASSDSESIVFRHEIDGSSFYVKRYHSTKGLRSWLGWSRIQIEWKNLLLFKRLNVPTINIVAYGTERCFSKTVRGVLVTETLENTNDLATMVKNHSPLLNNRAWVSSVINQVANVVRTLHDYCFAHNDLKWRNILVTQDGEKPQIYLIDCPVGQRWFGLIQRHRLLKDIACLDKVASQQLSRTQRMRFFLDYRGHSTLNAKDKQDIRRILTFFKGRK
ncbi:MAG: heptose kinase [Endozoicomonadaceae bacterium]|nr:heptose kinase [Endozoicomonadaceae bacterium]